MAAPGSYWTDILNAVLANYNAIQVTPLPPGVLRKRPIRLPSDPTSVTIISPVQDEIIEETFSGAGGKGGGGNTNTRICIVGYTIDLVTYNPGDVAVFNNLTAMLDWRQAIRDNLYVYPFPNAPSVVQVELEYGDLFNLAAIDAAFDTSVMRFKFHSKEPLT